MSQFDAAQPDSAEVFRIRFLGTKGQIKALMGELKNVSPEQRKAMGQHLNELKVLAEQQWESLKESQQPTVIAGGNSMDRTLPGTPLPVGTRHPLSLVRNEIVAIFRRLGFAVA